MRILKISKVRTFLVVIMIMTISLCCSSQVQANLLAQDESDYSYTVTGGEAEIYAGAKSLKDVTLPNTLGEGAVRSIGDSAFQSCTGLTSIIIPEGVINIGKNAFCNCSSLTTISLPQSVTSIGGGAFQSCTGLTSISIPQGVTSIEDRAFKSCTGLTSIRFNSAKTKIYDDTDTIPVATKIIGYAQSTANAYATKYKRKFEVIDTTNTLQSLAITTPATKLSYNIGDSLDITGLVVTGTYRDGSTTPEAITAANVTGFDSTTPVASQLLTITVSGQTVTYKVQIVAGSNATVLTRLAGSDRYKTASQIAKSGWSQSDYAILAYGENYPDALASAPLAKKYNAPILLTTSNSLPNTTKQALIDLKVENVIIIGGTGVIFASVETELQSMGVNTTRVFGSDKYDTAIKVAQQITTTPSALFVVTGEDYPDALSVASIASIKQIPIILVPNDSIPDSVKNYIATIKVSKTYVIGYSDIISDKVCNQFPNTERILGSDKYARNIAVNQKFNSDFKSENICVATGEGFADALTGTAYSAKISEPIILINFDSPTNTKGYYRQRLSIASNVYVFGGTGIIPDSVIENLNN